MPCLLKACCMRTRLTWLNGCRCMAGAGCVDADSCVPGGGGCGGAGAPHGSSGTGKGVTCVLLERSGWVVVAGGACAQFPGRTCVMHPANRILAVMRGRLCFGRTPLQLHQQRLTFIPVRCPPSCSPCSDATLALWIMTGYSRCQLSSLRSALSPNPTCLRNAARR